MKKIFLVFIFMQYALWLTAQNDKATNYINKYKEIAMQEMRRTGVPADITLAQGILESGYGESELAVKGNNHFGIKCKPEWTGDRMFKDDDFKGECFRVYASAEESYRDHSDFLKYRPYYKNLFTLAPNDYKGWAHGLKKAGYATQKNYPQLLISLIERYNLHQYTEEVLNNKMVVQQIAPEKKEKISIEKNSDPAYRPTNKQKDTVAFIPKDTVITSYPQGIFIHNGKKALWVPSNISLYALALQYKISYKSLLKINNLTEKEAQNIKEKIIYVPQNMSDKIVSFFK